MLLINSNDVWLKTSEIFCSNENAPVKIGDDKILQQTNLSKALNFGNQNTEIFVGPIKQLLEVIFPKVSQTNPKQKFLAILPDLTEASMREILRSSSENFKLSRFYVANLNDFLVDTQSIRVSTYNFLANGNEMLQQFTLQNENSSEIKAFEESRYKNWNKLKLRATLFPFNMVAKVDQKTYDLSSIGYSDGETLKIFARHFNFTIDFKNIPENNGHGQRLTNGTFTGSLRMLENNEVDIAANGRTIIDTKAQNIVFLQSMRQMQYVFTVPKKEWKDVNVFEIYFKFFDWKIYLMFVVVVISIPLILYTIERLYNVQTAELVKNVFTVLSITFSVTTPISKRLPTRCVLGALALAFLVIGNVFSSKMIDFFYNSDKYLQDVHTLEELFKSPYEIKPVLAVAQLFEEIDIKTAPKSHFFMNKILIKAAALSSKGDMYAYASPDNFEDLILSKKYSLMMPLLNVEELLRKYDDHMTYIKTTPYEYYVAMTIRKHVPMYNGEFSILFLI